jgi:hypothetical protein
VFPVSTTTAKRLARLLGWDGNPLRRRSDRLEAAIVTGLLAMFLIGAPVLAIVAGRVADGLGLREQHAQQAWRQVPATVLQGAATVSAPSDGSAGNWVPARWRTPGGRQLEGLVAVDSTPRPGQRVPVWTDGAGRLTAPPLTHGQIQADVALAAATAPLVLAVVLLAARGAARLILNRRRMAAWEQAWRSVGPRWTRQP